MSNVNAADIVCQDKCQILYNIITGPVLRRMIIQMYNEKQGLAPPKSFMSVTDISLELFIVPNRAKDDLITGGQVIVE